MEMLLEDGKDSRISEITMDERTEEKTKDSISRS